MKDLEYGEKASRYWRRECVVHCPDCRCRGDLLDLVHLFYLRYEPGITGCKIKAGDMLK